MSKSRFSFLLAAAILVGAIVQFTQAQRADEIDPFGGDAPASPSDTRDDPFAADPVDDDPFGATAPAVEPRSGPQRNSRPAPPLQPRYTPLGAQSTWPFATAPVPGNVRVKRRARIVWETYQEVIPQKEWQLREQVGRARESLMKAETEADRNQAAEELRQGLEDQFDRDYARREMELQELEDRVAKLRTTLDKRKDARDEIIEVRFKTYLHQAEGLTFPEPMGPHHPLLPAASFPQTMPATALTPAGPAPSYVPRPAPIREPPSAP